MDSFGIGMAGLVMACVASVGAFVLAFRQRRRRQAARPPADRPADRLEALGAAQADLAHRLEIVAAEARAPEERLQAMAGQLLGLIRDKNATFETALAGLDQLRARMRALEQIGEPAEARALLETLSGRIDALQAAQAAAVAGIEARIETLAAPETGAAELAARLAKLGEAKAAAVEAALARLGPLEARIAGLEGGPEALKRLEARLEALQREQGAARAELAGLKAEAGGPVKALGERLSELHAQKEAAVEAVLARLGPLEARLAGLEGRDPQAAVAALADRLGTLEGAGDRIAALAERLGGLHAQKDAAVEAALGRLAPLEARLQALEAGLATLGGRDPQDALDGLAARLEAAQAAREAAEAGMRERLAALEASPLAAEIEALQREQGAARAELAGLKAEAGGPVKALGERLSELHAQKEAAVEAVLARLGPLEARLAGLEGRDPQAAVAALADRLGTLEGAGDRIAALAERLGGLHAQKDAAVEAALGRLAPLEARLQALEAGLATLGGRDPQDALDGLAARLEAAQAAREAAEAGMRERLAALEASPLAAEIEALQREQGAARAELAGLKAEAGGPVKALGERLSELHAQKEAAVEAVLARLGPLEARLAGLEGRDPQAAVAALADRLGTLEGAGDRIAALAERLGGLHAQKDAAVEAALGRLAPLEARLQALEAGLATLGGRDPQDALDGLAARLEAAQAAREAAEAGMRERLAAIEGGEGRAAEIAAQLSELHAQKEAAVEAVLARLGPLEARLAGLEAGLGTDRQAEDDARAEAQAIATQLLAMRAAAAQTELFADRLALLEASLPRLSVAQSLMMQALERQAAVAGGPEAPLPGPPAEDPLAAFRDLPRIVSLHQK